MSDEADRLELVTQLVPAIEAALSAGGSFVVGMVERLASGNSQETWLVRGEHRTREGPVVPDDLILRCEPRGALLESDRAREFALLKALAPTSIPVPTVLFEIRLDDGRSGFLMERSPGRADRKILTRRDPLGLGDEGRLKVAADLCTILALVHSVDVESSGVRQIAESLPGDPARAALDFWETRLHVLAQDPDPSLDLALRWLHAHLPPTQPARVLVHGDFRPANVLVDAGRITALLDWEFATVGDHHQDLGWYLTRNYADENLAGGCWDAPDFLAAYSSAGGQPIDPARLAFWCGMSSLMLIVMALSSVSNFVSGTSTRPWAPGHRNLSTLVAAVLASADDVATWVA